MRLNILALLVGSILAVVATAFVGLAYGAVMAMSGSDATFGYLTGTICTRTCAGCRGPIERRGGWRTVGGSGRGTPAKAYCQPPRGTLDDVKDLAPYEVKQDAELPFQAAFAVVAPPLWILSFFLVRARIARNMARANERPQRRG